MKILYYLTILLLLSVNIYSQSSDSLSKYQLIRDDLWKSANENLTWYDIGMAAVMGIEKLCSKNIENKLIKIEPFYFEKDIKEKIGLPGHKSIGSYADWGYPLIAIGSRFTYLVGGELFGNKNHSKEDL